MNKIRLLELFGGIGACTKALKKLNQDVEVLDYVEIDKDAVNSYNAINGTNFTPQDITKWDKDLKDLDIIMHGSPCQDFSSAGLQAGGDKNSGTRSSLMYETIRIVTKLKPKIVIWENVRNILCGKHLHNFRAYQQTLRELGYNNYYQILNSKDYGIPQNRDRIFTVSIRNDIDTSQFMFPPKIITNTQLKDYIEPIVDNSYIVSDIGLEPLPVKSKYDINEEINKLQEKYPGKSLLKLFCNILISHQEIKQNDFMKCSYIGDQLKEWENQKIIYKTYCQTLTTKSDRIGVCVNYPDNSKEDTNNLVIRKLTPLECWRLMGFDEEDYNKASCITPRVQLYKQAGNSIVVNVLYYILKTLIEKQYIG